MMKKVISIVLAFVLCLSLCACSSNSLEGACRKADKLVNGWHDEAYGGCIYKGEYIKETDGYEISMYLVTARYPSSLDSEDGATFVKNTMTRRMLDELYPQLVEVFEGYDVSIAFILSDQNGNNTHSTILDGEVEFYN